MQLAATGSEATILFQSLHMEQYFNTLKSDLIYLHHYETEKQLYQAVESFAYAGTIMCELTHLIITKRISSKIYYLSLFGAFCYNLSCPRQSKIDL